MSSHPEPFLIIAALSKRQTQPGLIVLHSRCFVDSDPSAQMRYGNVTWVSGQHPKDGYASTSPNNRSSSRPTARFTARKFLALWTSPDNIVQQKARYCSYR